MILDPDQAGEWVGIGIAVIVGAAKYLRERWENSPPVEKAKKLDEARIDVGKALLDNDKAHLEELDDLARDHQTELNQYEARELNLTAEKGELLRQNAENARLHTEALAEIRADRDADRTELAAVRTRLTNVISDAAEERAECRRSIEDLHAQLRDLTLAVEKQKAQDNEARRAVRASHERETARLRSDIAERDRDLDDANRRGYRTAKRVENLSEKATGEKPPLTATDVWPEGKPLP